MVAIVAASDADKFKKLMESENSRHVTVATVTEKAFTHDEFQRSADCKYFREFLDTNGGES